MPGKVFLDTNILVCAHDIHEPEKQAAAENLIVASLRSGVGVISAQVLAEFFVTVTRKIRQTMPARRAREEIALLANFEVVETDATLILRAADGSMRWKLSFWDALILAAAERAGCETVYSEDLADGQKYGSVTVRNPFASKP